MKNVENERCGKGVGNGREYNVDKVGTTIPHVTEGIKVRWE